MRPDPVEEDSKRDYPKLPKGNLDEWHAIIKLQQEKLDKQ